MFAVRWFLGFVILSIVPAPLYGQSIGVPVLPIGKAIKLSGTFNGEFQAIKHYAPFFNSPGSGSDLYVRLLEIGLESTYPEWLDLTLVLNSEYIGDAIYQGDEKVTVDEVHFDVTIPGTPVYAVFGKKSLPFGLFENNFITNSLTEEAYEIVAVGFSLGISGPFGTDFSGTVYKGNQKMNQLFQSGIIDTTGLTLADAGRNIDSFILSFAAEPILNYLNLTAAFDSEPGQNRRNSSATVGFGASFPPAENLGLEGEYFGAFSRDRFIEAPRAFSESAYSITAYYRFIVLRRSHQGNGTYAGRRATIAARPEEIALRYEHFNDDGMSRSMKICSIESVYSLTGRYAFFQNPEVIAYISGELKAETYRVPPGKTQTSGNNRELYIRLGLNF